MNKEKVKELVAQLLVELGEDPQREGLRETPQRVADLYEEIFHGYESNPELDVTFAEQSDLVLQKGIPFYSMCEHHLLPFFGRVHIAYQPDGKVIGISKLSRLVDKYARRLQLQERMTDQIADELQTTGVKGVMVVSEGDHLCLRMRGPKSNGITVAAAARGHFEDPMWRNAAMELMQTVSGPEKSLESRNPSSFLSPVSYRR